MDAGLEAALYSPYDDDMLVSEELVYEQDGPHSPLTVRGSGDEWAISCACGYSPQAEEFWQAALLAERHLDTACFARA